MCQIHLNLFLHMKEQQIPLFTLETQEPVKQMDFLGITIQYEMCYTNILQILDLSRIPLLSEMRTEEDPLVIGGGQWDIPISYTSGKHMAKRIAAFPGSLRTIFTSLPIYLAGRSGGHKADPMETLSHRKSGRAFGEYQHFQSAGPQKTVILRFGTPVQSGLLRRCVLE